MDILIYFMSSVLVQLNIRADNFLLCENRGHFLTIFPPSTKDNCKQSSWSGFDHNCITCQ